MRNLTKQPNAMTIVKHRPHSAFVSPFEGLFNGFLGHDLSPVLGNEEAFRDHPRVNITEDKNGFKLTMLAPGYSREDLQLDVESDVLTISARKEQEKLGEQERYTRREFSMASFKRSFRLPESVDTHAIKAEHVNGVLTVELPRSEPAKPATRKIEIA